MKQLALLFTFLMGAISFALLTACASSAPSPISEAVTLFADYPSQVLGVVIDPTGNVLYVEPGSAAEKAGITPGDILQKVNNFSVISEFAQARTAVQQTKPGQAVIVELKRSGNFAILSIKPSAPALRTGLATATPVEMPDDYL